MRAEIQSACKNALRAAHPNSHHLPSIGELPNLHSIEQQPPDGLATAGCTSLLSSFFDAFVLFSFLSSLARSSAYVCLQVKCEGIMRNGRVFEY